VQRPTLSIPRLKALGTCSLAAVAFAGTYGSHGNWWSVERAAQDSPAAGPATAGHCGPATEPGETGPARFVAALYAAFDAERALEMTAFVDRWYRVPGNEGYDAALDHVAAKLRAAGFGTDERLELRVIESGMRSPTWTPLSAKLALLLSGEEPRVLHAFSDPVDRDRVMLPVNAPSADVEGPIAFQLSEVTDGSLLVTSQPLNGAILHRAGKLGARAVLSSSLFPFTVDPSGAERHLDAIRFVTVAPGTSLPVAQISPRTHQVLQALRAERGDVRLSFQARTETAPSTLRTLVAAVVGASRPNEAVAIPSHVQEPGAGDNASGVAGMAEAALTLAGLLRQEKIDWPARTIEFIWGDEIRQTRVWLENTQRECVAGISADMLGQSPERTGSIALLERSPDPGALVVLPPDEHTPWGFGEVGEDDILPNGLNLIARTALHDVARHVGGWRTSENPWEGGSDHDVFLSRGIPGVLIWHFTDFTYHTGLDRMDMLDGEELRRSATVVMSAALAVADARKRDLARYLASLELEKELRVAAARRADEKALVQQWQGWCRGVERWLRAICSGK